MSDDAKGNAYGERRVGADSIQEAQEILNMERIEWAEDAVGGLFCAGLLKKDVELHHVGYKEGDARIEVTTITVKGVPRYQCKTELRKGEGEESTIDFRVIGSKGMPITPFPVPLPKKKK
jgi:hypothetical protein